MRSDTCDRTGRRKTSYKLPELRPSTELISSDCPVVPHSDRNHTFLQNHQRYPLIIVVANYSSDWLRNIMILLSPEVFL